MSVTNESGKSKDLLNSARLAKLQLLVLELRKRELRQELTNVECQFQQLLVDIELKGIQVP
jgi:hypothetical protein